MDSFELSKEIYSLKSLKDTIYWFSKSYDIVLSQNEMNYVINCYNTDGEFFSKFLRAANDFSLRDIIDSQTKDIKSLVIAKAFYPEMIDFQTIGDFDDPVNMDNKYATE